MPGAVGGMGALVGSAGEEAGSSMMAMVAHDDNTHTSPTASAILPKVYRVVETSSQFFTASGFPGAVYTVFVPSKQCTSGAPMHAVGEGSSTKTTTMTTSTRPKTPQDTRLSCGKKLKVKIAQNTTKFFVSFGTRTCSGLPSWGGRGGSVEYGSHPAGRWHEPERTGTPITFAWKNCL